ncbi:MAG: M20 family metallo-hydrolase [Bacteroidaceae bacterium]|nr:M20 family metallo-hydrolase [Bacteroidaceae bacterium]
MNENISSAAQAALSLLQSLIRIPRHSREEDAGADFLEQEMLRRGLSPQRKGNNLWAIAPHYDASRPTLLLNAHLDTVRPVQGWTRSPYAPTLSNSCLYGLGSNDCGGGLVSLFEVFCFLRTKPQPYNLIFAASAEEEVSGQGGISSILPSLPKVDVAIVGEPTSLQPAVAERGLMVLDCTAHGKSGHAARQEGINALYLALDDIQWVRTYRFPKVSDLLGPVQVSATIIQAGTQHNVVPDTCTFTLDVRVNELYSNLEVLQIIQSHLKSEVQPRSTRLRSSSISRSHPLVLATEALGLHPFGSPTLSDQALMPFPSMKLGPGDSARSHTADEYIEVSDIERAIRLYLQLLNEKPVI